MILHIKDVKDLCSKFMSAIDSDGTPISETLELVTVGDTLYANITNQQYYVQYKLKLDTPTTFHATVLASTFLKLMQMITTETVELTVGESLIIRGNGQYTLPLVYQGDTLLELPRIEIQNVLNELDMETGALTSILEYNDKELSKGLIANPVQRLFYLDNYGAVTHTKYGACVNQFNLNTQFHIVFDQKFAKLFKLFDSTLVHVVLGKDAVDGDVVQRKIIIESPTVKITAILSSNDENLDLYASKVNIIRGIATKSFPYSVTIDKDKTLQALNRLMVLNPITANNKTVLGTFKFDNAALTISDASQKNFETLVYSTNSTGFTQGDAYTNKLDISAVKAVLEASADSNVVVSFGDHQSIAVTRGNIINVVQERTH